MTVPIRTVAIAFAAIALFGASFGQETPESKLRKISVEDGRELVQILLQPTGCTKAKCTFDRIPDPHSPQFYVYYVTWPNPVGSPHIGTWAVDPVTAEVWEANACVEHKTAALTKLQASLRKGIGLTDDEYRKAQRPGPMCEPGEKPRVDRGK